MSDFSVRRVAEGEQRATLTVLSQALHNGAISDERWEMTGAAFPADRKFAAFDGGDPIGIASSFATETRIPGGQALPTAAVDGIAVRADWTRRGVLTAMMARQLPDFAARGEVLAGLHASEATIYGRFGYGAATYGKTVRLVKPDARWRPEVPVSGRVRLLSPADAAELIPALYERIGLHRAGMIARPAHWWTDRHINRVNDPKGMRVAVHTGPDGDDGYVAFTVVPLETFDEPEKGAAVEVKDLQAAAPETRAALWRFLLGMDLVSEIRARAVPADETLAELLVDSRACRVAGLGDDLWLRLVDVEAALSARAYLDAEPVVLDVVDTRLPDNTGRYAVGPGGAKRTDAAAGARLDVETLAMLYLGEWKATTLVRAGRMTVTDPAVAASLDELFRTAEKPWCGTNF
jgi:predicted acetyltransferase